VDAELLVDVAQVRPHVASLTNSAAAMSRFERARSTDVVDVLGVRMTMRTVKITLRVSK
jgi:hypothetical protein